MTCNFLKAAFAALALLAPGLARAEWYEASSPHFVVYADDKPERVKEYSTQLERFHAALLLIHRRPDVPIAPVNRVTVYVLDDLKDLRRLTGSESIRGFYVPRVSGSVAFSTRKADGSGKRDLSPRQVLFHEYGHHFMFSQWPHIAYPAWYVEGFAEFGATVRFLDNGSVVIGDAPGYRYYGVSDHFSLSLDRMLSDDIRTINGEQIEVMYGRGWALTHYGLIGPGRAQLVGYLTAINEGKRAAEAAKAFGEPRLLNLALDRYVGGKLSAYTIKPEALPTGKIDLRKLGVAEAAVMDVRMRSKGGVDKRTAPGVYAAAQRAAAPYPNDPSAQLMLAEAAYDAKDFPAAEAAADRAVAADPERVKALIYKALARIAVAREAKDKGAATWDGIRTILSSANLIDPDDPEALALYYRSYTYQGAPPPGIARQALYRAYELAPFDSRVRMDAGMSWIADGKTYEALGALKPVAYSLHGGKMREYATKLVEALDSSGAEAARELLDQRPADLDEDDA